MKEAIYWLNVNLLITAVMWLPYIINQICKQRLAAFGYDENVAPVSAWATRAKKAHYNAVENLVIFAPAVLGFMMLPGADFKVIECSVGIYMFSRVVHYFCFTFKIAYLRTLAFMAGWGSTMYILFKVCELAGS